MSSQQNTNTRVQLKGNHEDFIVFVDDNETYNKWKTDRSIPLTHFVSSFNIFSTGDSGQYATPSKLTLETEFGTEEEEKIMVQILEKGEAQEIALRERRGSTNESMGAYGSTRV